MIGKTIDFFLRFSLKFFRQMSLYFQSEWPGVWHLQCWGPEGPAYWPVGPYSCCSGTVRERRLCTTCTFCTPPALWLPVSCTWSSSSQFQTRKRTAQPQCRGEHSFDLKFKSLENFISIKKNPKKIQIDIWLKRRY